MHDVPPEPAVDLVLSVLREIDDRVERAISAGVALDRVIVDPGFGFGKDWRQNLELLRRLSELKVLELPILVGFSRKSTIGLVLDLPVEERLEGTLATTALAIAGGADIVRVHDVLPNVRVARMTDAVCRPIIGRQMTRVFVALGANLGDRQATLESAIRELAQIGPVSAVSSIYETDPWGFVDQPAYLERGRRNRHGTTCGVSHGDVARDRATATDECGLLRTRRGRSISISCCTETRSSNQST